ncbi:hypothetical protein QCA50_009718 [Cerrena zonata]|uniref:Ribonuclease H1 N-terminal domain-containing protein n=1 Tax=Cerrena zonata TaxID=2478898 RepID=A0AAW0GBA6_9APHY
MAGPKSQSRPRRAAPITVPSPPLTNPSRSMPPYTGSRGATRNVAPHLLEEDDVVEPSPSPTEVSSPERTPSPDIDPEAGQGDLHDILAERVNASRLVRQAVLAEVELRLAHLALQTRDVIRTHVLSHEPRPEFNLRFLQDQNLADGPRRRTSRPSSTRGNTHQEATRGNPRQTSTRARRDHRSQPPESTPSQHHAPRNTQRQALNIPRTETSNATARTRNAPRARSPAAVPPPPPSVASSTAVASGSSVASDDDQPENVCQIDRDDGSRDERRRWYVITKGRGKIGVFQRWLGAAPYCHRVPGAQYQSFGTRAEALRAFNAAERDGHTEFI